eukprot:Amastigsp_a340122_146.p4 type:complete len:100 gc:universal Amastigsp_a340122_146:719-420(-)
MWRLSMSTLTSPETRMIGGNSSTALMLLYSVRRQLSSPTSGSTRLVMIELSGDMADERTPNVVPQKVKFGSPSEPAKKPRMTTPTVAPTRHEIVDPSMR